MHIGFAKRDISPPLLPEGDLSIPILGWRRERAKPYREIHDPLYARAMAVVNDGQRALVFACDLFGDAVGFTARCAEKIEQRCGVPGEHVFLGCTHTHTSPETLNICPRQVASWWVDRLVDELVQTGAEALEAARPGTLHWAELPCPGLVTNRRVRYVDAYEAEHGPLGPRVRERNTTLDEALRVLCAADKDGRPLGAVANFACHPVIMQTAPMISADYCGPAASGVEEALGGDFVCLYLNGPSGDINPVCRDTRDYGDCEKIGGAIAAKAIEAVREAVSLDSAPDHPIAGRLCTVEVEKQELPHLEALRADEQRLLKECRRAEAAGDLPMDADHPLGQLVYVQEQLALESMPRRREVPLHALRIGEVRLVSFPGELLSALGKDTRDDIGGKVMLTHCSRAHAGYICPREAYEVGGYEVGPGTWAWLKSGCGEAMVEAAIALARAL